MTSYVRFDFSPSEPGVCALDAGGDVRFEGKVRGLLDERVAFIQAHADDAERVAIEIGQLTAMISRAMEVAGLPVVCIETRHAHNVLSASPVAMLR